MGIIIYGLVTLTISYPAAGCKSLFFLFIWHTFYIAVPSGNSNSARQIAPNISAILSISSLVSVLRLTLRLNFCGDVFNNLAYERFEKGQASDRDRHMGNTINYLCEILESPENNSEEAVNAYSFIYGAAKGGAEMVRNEYLQNIHYFVKVLYEKDK